MGRVRSAMKAPRMPSGTLTANSQGQGATARMADAMDGPRADAMEPTVAFSPTPGQPAARIDEADQRAVDAHDAGGAEALQHAGYDQRRQRGGQAQAREATVNSTRPAW